MMRYDRKSVTLKNGKTCILRSPEPQDAKPLLQHLRLTSGETRNMLRYDDEIVMTLDEERCYLQNLNDAPSEIMISAYVEDKLAGNASIHPVMRLDKIRHRASFGISVKKDYWHMGIGIHLLTACVQAARVMGYEQVELEVVADNVRAVTLYERFGFITYGRRPHGFKFRDDRYADDLLMILKL